MEFPSLTLFLSFCLSLSRWVVMTLRTWINVWIVKILKPKSGLRTTIFFAHATLHPMPNVMHVILINRRQNTASSILVMITSLEGNLRQHNGNEWMCGANNHNDRMSICAILHLAFIPIYTSTTTTITANRPLFLLDFVRMAHKP